MPLFALSILTGAFLLFQVQPIIARYLLPVYGGTPAVWTTCMLCFQAGLLIGYAYTHGLVSLLRHHPRGQASVHGVLLLLALLWLPITPTVELASAASGDPVWGIVSLLVQSIGLPFILVAASAPLLQHWFATCYPGRSPYRLYAVSNFGSLLGLLSYPFLVEPFLGLQMQTWVWSGAFGIYILLTACAAIGLSKAKIEQSDNSTKEAHVKPSIVNRMTWIIYAMLGSVLLLAITNQITQDIAMVPFLWILPLALYLVSFILCFDHPRWYRRWFWMPLCGASIVMLNILMHRDFAADEWSIITQAGICLCALFTCCMICHGELVRVKPSSSYLTGFYLSIALGGALGGGLVAVIAPRIFDGMWELHLSLLVLVGLVGWGRWNALRRSGHAGRWWLGYAALCAWILWGLLALSLWWHQANTRAGSLTMQRGFYGVLQVKDEGGGSDYLWRSLYYGRINHGLQLYKNGEASPLPQSYYLPPSGAGIAVNKHPKRQTRPRKPLRIGVAGLGIGTLAAYALPGDTVRFYEINPQVEPLAREHFSYLDACRATTLEVVDGDARIEMERELSDRGSQNYDLLYLDVFSGDAIPVHLLTREAFEIYSQHLVEDGLLAVHITNLHLDLEKVVLSQVAELNFYATVIERIPEFGGEYYSKWVLMGAELDMIERMAASAKTELRDKPRQAIIWTDDYSNLLQILK